MFTLYIEMDTLLFALIYKRCFCFLGCSFERYTYCTHLGSGFFHCCLNLHFLMLHFLVSSDVMLVILSIRLLSKSWKESFVSGKNTQI